MTTLNHHKRGRGSAQQGPGHHRRRRVADDHPPQLELIINAAGNNMPPSTIETAVPAASLLGAHAVAIGHRRHYLTAPIPTRPDAAARSPPSMASPTSPRRLGQSTANCRVELTRLKMDNMSAAARPDGAALSRAESAISNASRRGVWLRPTARRDMT